jgi:hypothetical protein
MLRYLRPVAPQKDRAALFGRLIVNCVPTQAALFPFCHVFLFFISFTALRVVSVDCVFVAGQQVKIAISFALFQVPGSV